MNFFSHRYLPSEDSGQRLRGAEQYMIRQSRELYIHLRHLERRLTELEARVAVLEQGQLQTAQDETSDTL